MNFFKSFLLLSVLCLVLIISNQEIASAQDPHFDTHSANANALGLFSIEDTYLNRPQDLTEPPTPPCSCDCFTKIHDLEYFPTSKFTKFQSLHVRDDELTAARINNNNPELQNTLLYNNFQRFTLQLNGCANGISTIKITFMTEGLTAEQEANLKELAFVYQHITDPAGTVTNPQSLGENNLYGATISFNVNVLPCSTSTLVFDIYSNAINNGSHHIYNLKVEIYNSAGKECEFIRQWNTDHITSTPLEKIGVRNDNSDLHKSEANISPIPADNYIKLNLDGEYDYQILDALGKLRKSGTTNGRSKLDITDLTNGNYLITVNNGSNRKTFKFFINK